MHADPHPRGSGGFGYTVNNADDFSFDYSGVITNVSEELSTFWWLLASVAVLFTVVAVHRRFYPAAT